MITMDHHPHHHNNPQSVEILGHDQAASETHLNSLLCSLSLLKNKVNEVESMATSSSSSSSLSLAGLGTLIQEIIVTASSMMFNCQQMALGSPPPPAATTTTTTTGNNNPLPVIYGYDDHQQDGSQFHAFNNKANKYDDEYNRGLDNRDSREGAHQGQASTSFLPSDEPTFYWYNDTYTSNSSNTNTASNCTPPTIATITNTMVEGAACDIIEIDASELLAKYTHYCQVCSKGFKRDANLRMHMRAHGDEYKSSAALSNPLKNIIKGDGAIENSNIGTQGTLVGTKKYSCPQEGCRWNKNHAKFQPLKSMICVKNHYKRSHCPKMYGCSRCNRKQFSVLSDLKTHEKHCGDLRWRCSCGTTFSRKDKLMGHVALFVGHSPVGLRDKSNRTTTDVVANIIDPST